MGVGYDAGRVRGYLASGMHRQVEAGFNFGPGYVADLVTRLLEPHGFGWVLRADGTAAVLPSDTVDLIEYDTHVLIGSDSGMVGVPELMVEEGPRVSLDSRVSGVRVRTLLDSRLTLDRGFVVNSELVGDSVFRPISVVHKGTNRGRAFYTVCEGRKV